MNWGAHCNLIALWCTIHPRSVELFFHCLGIILLISLLETSNRHVLRVGTYLTRAADSEDIESEDIESLSALYVYLWDMM